MRINGFLIRIDNLFIIWLKILLIFNFEFLEKKETRQTDMQTNRQKDKQTNRQKKTKKKQTRRLIAIGRPFMIIYAA